MENPIRGILVGLLSEGHKRDYEEAAGQNYESSPVHDWLIHPWTPALAATAPNYVLLLGRTRR
jgi:hypothetical protein